MGESTEEDLLSDQEVFLLLYRASAPLKLENLRKLVMKEEEETGNKTPKAFVSRSWLIMFIYFDNPGPILVEEVACPPQ